MITELRYSLVYCIIQHSADTVSYVKEIGLHLDGRNVPVDQREYPSNVWYSGGGRERDQSAHSCRELGVAREARERHHRAHRVSDVTQLHNAFQFNRFLPVAAIISYHIIRGIINLDYFDKHIDVIFW